jgi:hypothetical protein
MFGDFRHVSSSNELIQVFIPWPFGGFADATCQTIWCLIWKACETEMHYTVL